MQESGSYLADYFFTLVLVSTLSIILQFEKLPGNISTKADSQNRLQLNSIPSEKLSAAKIVNSLSDNIFFGDDSIIHTASFLRQQKYLIQALESLRVNPGRLIGKFHEIRKSILRPDNCFAFLTADLEVLNRNYGERSTRPWLEFFPESSGRKPAPEELSVPFRCVIKQGDQIGRNFAYY
jgi:hypothetical protein